MNPQPLDRRAFLRTGLAAAAALALPDRGFATPALRPASPIRVRGRVTARGRGLARVAVTDGLDVALTDADGRYELVSDAARRWLSLSLPAGHRVPVSETGTALLHRPIRPGRGGEMQAAFELEPIPGGDERHALLLLADTQTEDMWEIGRLMDETVPDVRQTVRSLGDVPVLGVACGDIMFDHLELYPEYERAVAAMGVPFFQVVGNHDMDFEGRTDEASTATFQRHFGPGHYSFDQGAIHYVVLDDVFWHGAGYLGYITAEQLTWLAADLERVEPGSTVVVCVHIPVMTSQHLRRGEERPSLGGAVMNREALWRLLEPYDAHILSGHTHENEHVFEGGVHEHVNGTVCGSWWAGDICRDGTPNGYGVYEAHGAELRWRYKATGRDAAHQMRLYAPGSDARAPDELVANVWNWDPEWSVVWYEDGERRGAMARRVGLDPRSVVEHTGSELPPHRPWVEPVPTSHLFYAPVSAGTGRVTVEATDRFGTAYAESIEV